MKLCVFQGTFNPIHNAHLRVAKYVYEKLKPDKFLFIPAAIPPHKSCDIRFSEHRLNMVRLAVQENPVFEVSDIEYRLAGKSYTYRTISELYKIFPNIEKIYFIIGTDAFRKIEQWYCSDDLKKLVKFVVLVREKNFDETDLDYLKEKGYDFELQSLPFNDISSTKVRTGLERGYEGVKSDIPTKVMEYIKKNGLYINK